MSLQEIYDKEISILLYIFHGKRKFQNSIYRQNEEKPILTLPKYFIHYYSSQINLKNPRSSISFDSIYSSSPIYSPKRKNILSNPPSRDYPLDGQKTSQIVRS